MKRVRNISVALCMLIMLFVPESSGQNLVKAFGRFVNGDVAGAKEIFHDAIKAKKDLPVAYLGMSMCLGDSSVVSRPRYADAYKNLLLARKCMLESSEEDINRYYRMYGTTGLQIDDGLEVMASCELARIAGTKQEAPLKSYIKTFSEMPSYVAEAERLLLRVRWNKAVKSNSVDGWVKFRKFYTDSICVARADSAIEAIRWNKACSSDELLLLNKYVEMYPDHNKDSLVALARHDIMLKNIRKAPISENNFYKIISWRESWESSKSYMEKYIDEFLKEFPESPSYNEVWEKQGLMRFAYSYRMAEEVHEPRWFVPMNTHGTPFYMRRTLKEFANHSKKDSVMQCLHSMLLKTGFDNVKHDRLPWQLAFLLELFPDDSEKERIVKILTPLAKKYFELCVQSEIDDFSDCILHDSDGNLVDSPWLPRDWRKRMKAAEIFQSPWGMSDDEIITACAPYEPAFWMLRRMIEEAKPAERVALARRYMPKLPNHRKALEKMIALMQAPVKKVVWKSVSDSINTANDEYSPAISANGRYMYFTRRKTNGASPERIWVSTRTEDGQWGAPRYCSTVNKSRGNFDPECVYPNGNSMVYFHNGSLYMAVKTDEGVMTPQGKKLPFSVSPWSADVSFTYDGNAVLFASSGGNVVGMHHHPWNFEYYGGANIDIFVCLRDSHGNWGKPINLGDVINTPFIDRSPYLASDMKTLYFASNRHGALSNECDVFMCKRLKDDSWTEWSEPVNVGRGINTFGNDWQLSLSADGSTMYMTSNEDILQATVPADMRPEPVTLLYGKIENVDGEKVVGYVRWEDLNTGERLGEMEADVETGEYFITLPHGRMYGYCVYKDNYVAESGNVYVDKSARTVDRIRHDVTLATEEQVLSGKVELKLNNIFFNQNSATLNPQSDTDLKRIIDFLNKHENPTIEVSGHTDNTGDNEANRRLSQRRAEAVRDRMVQLGYDAGKIVAVGYGNDRPKSDNNTAEGRAANRRVEFRIMPDK